MIRTPACGEEEKEEKEKKVGKEGRTEGRREVEVEKEEKQVKEAGEGTAAEKENTAHNQSTWVLSISVPMAHHQDTHHYKMEEAEGV